MGEQQRFLRQHGHGPAVRRHVDTCFGVGEDAVAEGDASGVGAQQPGDEVQQRRFPGTVGAENRENTT